VVGWWRGRDCQIAAFLRAGLILWILILGFGGDVAEAHRGEDGHAEVQGVGAGQRLGEASYYIQASESGGEPPGRWWGPGAKALGFEPGRRVS
jgi:hypothetical protein